jgi:hypothetical protein
MTTLPYETYTAPDDNIHFDLIEGDPGYSVTRCPRDMKGCIGRLAETLLERFGGAALVGESTGARATPARRRPRLAPRGAP